MQSTGTVNELDRSECFNVQCLQRVAVIGSHSDYFYLLINIIVAFASSCNSFVLCFSSTSGQPTSLVTFFGRRSHIAPTNTNCRTNNTGTYRYVFSRRLVICTLPRFVSGHDVRFCRPNAESGEGNTIVVTPIHLTTAPVGIHS